MIQCGTKRKESTQILVLATIATFQLINRTIVIFSN